MNQNVITRCMLSGTAALLLASGSALSAGYTDVESQPNVRSSQGGLMAAATVTKVAASLNVQPGDEGLFAAARPIQFTAIPGDREFSGELIARAKRPDAIRAMSRVAPLMKKKSAFVEEVVIRVPAGVSASEMAGALMATGEYESIEPNWKVFQLATVPNDPQYGSSWQHTRIQSDLAWDITTGSPDVIIAVCDSGIDSDHPDLAAALVSGYNSVDNLSEADGASTEDLNGHGTFVAGCAAAIGNNNTGVTGVGWDFKIMPIRVSNLSSGNASTFDIHEGARWAAANGAQVVNASYSGATAGANNTAARDVKALGGILLWASGNDGQNITNGNLPDLTIVGSTSSNDNRSGFSNFGNALDIVAPGASVRSTRRGGTYGPGSGTSYASPIAAGVAGMIFAANLELGPEDVQDILYTSADDRGAAGYDNFYGNGRVNTFNAVSMAVNYVPRIPIPLTQDFESAAWLDSLTPAGGSVSTVVDAEAPSGNAALALDAGESVETAPLAGRTALNRDYAVSFSARVDGVPAFETLLVEYQQESGDWVTVFEAVSPGADNGYVSFDGVLPEDFAFHGSKVRLSANNSSGTWMIDDLTIDEGRTEAILPFADGFGTGSLDSRNWDALTNGSIDLVSNDFVAALGNDGRLETAPLSLIDLVAIDQWAWFILAGSGLDVGDVINVEYRTELVGWTSIDLIDIAGIGGVEQGFEYKLPLTAIGAAEFQLRINASTGGGQVFVDDVNIGTTRLPDLNPGCSLADVAEPFGVINFFDISAFIGLYNAGDSAADLAAPFGTFNFFDISAYITAYNAGCP